MELLGKRIYILKFDMYCQIALQKGYVSFTMLSANSWVFVSLCYQWGRWKITPCLNTCP